MRILHVNMATAGGGLEQYLQHLFNELAFRGHKSLLLFGEALNIPVRLENVKTFFIDGITHIHCAGLQRKLAYAKAILDEERPDIVFIHQVLNPSLIDLLTEQRPSLRFVHGFKMICPGGRKAFSTTGRVCPFPLSFLCQARAYPYRCMPRNPLLGLRLILASKRIVRLHRSRSRMVVASRFIKDILICNDFERDRIALVPLFTYLPDPASMNDSRHEDLILAVGRVVPEKGFHHLIRAFHKIDQKARLMIAGDGPFLGDLKALTANMGESERVFFPGWLTQERLTELYGKCSMVVLPSIAPETFGMVGIEAMAFGKPVVAFDIGGISEWLIDRTTGFLVPPGDEEELREKIDWLLANPQMAEEMGNNGRAYFEKRFLPEHHMNRLLELFQREIDSFQHADKHTELKEASR
jgi:glycosyltransferase involved in cell wall biosynthesis